MPWHRRLAIDVTALVNEQGEGFVQSAFGFGVLDKDRILADWARELEPDRSVVRPDVGGPGLGLIK